MSKDLFEYDLDPEFDLHDKEEGKGYFRLCDVQAIVHKEDNSIMIDVNHQEQGISLSGTKMTGFLAIWSKYRAENIIEKL